MQNKTLQTKRVLRTALLILLLSEAGMGKGYAYDFCAVCSSGQTLYYNIVDAANHYVALTYPSNSNCYWCEYVQPSGNIILPETIQYNGINYTVTEIGDNAFYACDGMTGSLIIPNSVITIGNGAFTSCCGFSSLIIGNAVTSIGSNAFDACWRLSGDLVIPNSMIAIGEYAFLGCESFTGNLTIGNSVITIGYGAFEGCYSFTGDLTIGNSVTTIGDEAFYGCSGFTGNLTIGNSVTTIGSGAFYDCSGFTSLIIPNSVTTIGNEAFVSCSGLTGSLAIPNSVTSIGDRAFSWCSGLSSIFIPSSITVLEGNAFSCCAGIEQITVESGNPVYDSRGNCNAIIETAANTLVTGCVNTVVPNTVTIIGYDAFSGCGLTSVILPTSVTTIEDFAYGMCDNLTVVEIPNHVVSIGNGVFASCSGIEQITVEDGNPVYDSRGNCNAIIETVSNTLIQGCKSTVIPNSVVKIGDYSFRGYQSLTSIEMPDSVLEIGDWAFCGSGLSGKLTIGNFVTNIGDLSFSACNGLTSIEIGNSVTRIGKQAFMECENLSGDLIIPNSVIVIDEWAFFNWDEYGFDGTLVLGNSLDSIKYKAFGGCLFNTIVSLNDVPPTFDYELEIYPYPNLIVRCGNKETYEVSNWAYCVNNIEEDCAPYNVIINEVNIIGGNISASVNSIELGEEVQLTITPNEGMMLISLIVSNANDPSQTVPVYSIGKSSSIYGFIMPPFDVVITATFGPATTISENIEALVYVYPNPTNGQAKIEAEDLKHINISNMLGQIIYDGNASGNEFTYDFSKHKAGIYLIRIETANGVAVKKVSVTR